MLKSYGWGGVVAHKILFSAPVPLELIGIWVGLGFWLGFGDLGLGTGLDSCQFYTLFQICYKNFWPIMMWAFLLS